MFSDIEGIPIAYLEGLGVFFLTCAIFRLQLKGKLTHIFIVNFIITILNHILFAYSPAPDFSGLLNLFIFILFLHIIMVIPLIWSFIVGLTGYTLLGLVQVCCVYVMNALDIIKFDPVGDSMVNTFSFYIIQTCTFSIAFLLTFLLTRSKLGFTFTFKKLTFKNEKYVAHFLIYGTIASIIICNLLLGLAWSFILLSIPMLYLLFFSIQKELHQYQHRKQRQYMK